MRIAVISDVHANLEALTAVMHNIEKSNIERVFFLGDIVGYGVDPNKCIRLICDLCEIKLLGNHDYVAMGLQGADQFNVMAKESIMWTQKMLKRKSVERMSDFDMEATFLDYYMTHASPEDPSDWNYLFSESDAARGFERFTQSVCFVGHSHIPGVFVMRPDGTIGMQTPDSFTVSPDHRYIVNVGSVGQPRDGNRDACYVIVDTNESNFEFRRVPYDLSTAQNKMRKAQLPEFLITRLESGQ
jgi:diadenosine tetraphosphatase ApaH/serine/threonine PP2A family protein phosphatase